MRSLNEPVNNMIKSMCLTILLVVIGACTQIVTNPRPSILDNSRVVTGTVTYRERIALPPDAVVQVQLLDVSLMDVSAKQLAEQTIKPQHQVPIPFRLVFRSGDIDERMTYAVRATIRSGEKLLFVTDRSYSVLTGGMPGQVDLVLVRP